MARLPEHDRSPVRFFVDNGDGPHDSDENATCASDAASASIGFGIRVSHRNAAKSIVTPRGTLLRVTAACYQ